MFIDLYLEHSLVLYLLAVILLLCTFTCSCVIFICTHASVESVQCAKQLIGSSMREEMLAYVSRQVGQKLSMLARYAGLEEDGIQQIKSSSQNRPSTIMAKIQERLTWNELLSVVQKHVS